jgi:starch synthase (maltosyl-transferring)
MSDGDWGIQDPEPGRHQLKFRGDTLTVTLTLTRPRKGRAWLRTNIGNASVTRTEIIAAVDSHLSPLGKDWFDIAMKPIDSLRFRITVVLSEVGHFEAKCLFVEEGKFRPLWPSGANTVINVASADSCCANTLYNAFVRQFGPNKSADARSAADPEAEAITELDRAGYAVIPPSGTFRDLIRELDFIIGELGCRFIQLLPVHPTPTTYGRMGRFGSPYAALSFTAVDAALAQFDPKATPLEQFIELVDAVHQRNASLLLDIAINHTGWAASLHETHPEWLLRDPEGKIEVPGAWGVRWEDLTSLDYSHKDLWQYMAQVFLTWCHRGVDGFRCDAGYMIPVPAWRYIVAKVREQYPDTLFLLEGLGGPMAVTRQILDTANFDWAYSELFQNYDRSQIEAYLPEAFAISQQDGLLTHFAETHDNLRLAARSPVWARMRTALCALCSDHGAFGFANGVEWLATEKIDVHNAPSLNWGASENQVGHIRQLNRLLAEHPAFHTEVELQLIQRGPGNHLALLRRHRPTGKMLLVVANLDDGADVTATWAAQALGTKKTAVDLITGKKVGIQRSGEMDGCRLAPGEVLCLCADSSDFPLAAAKPGSLAVVAPRLVHQRLLAKVQEVWSAFQGSCDLQDLDLEQAAQRLFDDPVDFCRQVNHDGESRVIFWHWPQALSREVMLPPGFFLLVKAPVGFRARIADGSRTLVAENSLETSDGSHFALFAPLPEPVGLRRLTLKLSVYTPGHAAHAQGHLLLLSGGQNARVRQRFRRSHLADRDLVLLGTNHLGGMLRAPVRWGELASRYDALLAANFADVPQDRRILLSRCRAWMVFQGFSQDVDVNCLDTFGFDDHSRGQWTFDIPTGQGDHVLLELTAEMLAGKNSIRLTLHRVPSEDAAARLSDDQPVELILRPDIEDRSFHETTKAYLGPEQAWPRAVTAFPDGFVFAPHPSRRLKMTISPGVFRAQPEWYYMVHRPLEADRGLDPDSDLFSPGYFSVRIQGGASVELVAQAFGAKDPAPSDGPPAPVSWRETRWQPLAPAMARALDHYVVRRNDSKTVIAGYPWFLDWGRDSLIVVRGMIAAGRRQEAGDILKTFAAFEKNGTLPNMIRGIDATDRDTSDAPLWFFTACADLVKAGQTEGFLDEKAGNRTIRDVLAAIGHAYAAGTPNGIRMDPDSCLIYSPSHFTWMDTNHPAGSPRQGYPVEIQALWHRALRFLAAIDASNPQWASMAVQAANALTDLFWDARRGYLCDCRHGQAGQSAKEAVSDDALRPNQLLAITLGALTDPVICRTMLDACQQLLVPGAIRSLADQPVRYPLPVMHNGTLLNDPLHPYRGRYEGDEDTRRKPAYHNGTAWTWPFPSFCEAWARVYGVPGKDAALAWLGSSVRLINRGCVGQIPEILDGDFPHRQRGCDAQAWGVSELLRVWLKLSDQAVARF